MQQRDSRTHNYEFVHVGLRQRFLSAPSATVEMIVDKPGSRWLKWFWRRPVGSNVAADLREPEGALNVHEHTIADRPALVVEVPAATRPPEAPLLAMLPPVDSTGDPARYFTLEISAADPDQTTIAEWTDEGQHMNYGQGPDAQIEAFAAAVERFL